MIIPAVLCGVAIGTGYTIFFDSMVSEDWRGVVIGSGLAVFGAVCTFWA